MPVCVVRTCLRAYTHRQARTGRHCAPTKKEVLKVAFNNYAKDNKKSFNQGEDGFWRRNNNKY
jgi:hypothetical protein